MLKNGFETRAGTDSVFRGTGSLLCIYIFMYKGCGARHFVCFWRDRTDIRALLCGYVVIFTIFYISVVKGYTNSIFDK